MLFAHITQWESPLLWFAFLGGFVCGAIGCALVLRRRWSVALRHVDQR